MAAKSGDLIRTDRHGAVVVPVEKIDAMQAALDGLIKQEAGIIAAARPRRDRREPQGGVSRLNCCSTALPDPRRSSRSGETQPYSS